ncbi:MAG: TIGR03619 family F420-dependent LLM class oxidoreductase [Anaerolineae bacterium]
MRYAICVTNLGTYSDPGVVARLAAAAEDAGWEGLFIWDHLGFVWDAPACDPWVALTAAAASTNRLRLGTAVTPVPRRRPHVLATTLASLDILSKGRAIIGVGIGGVPREYEAFGENSDAKQRGAMLDEALAIMDGLWSGETVTYHGQHYTVEGVTLKPPPVQRPRVPVWVGGNSGPALRRAARWDGWMPDSADIEKIVMTPADLSAKLSVLQSHRTSDGPFDVVFMGYSTPADGALAQEYAEAGATWWLEQLHDRRGSYEAMLARVTAGPFPSTK